MDTDTQAMREQLRPKDRQMVFWYKNHRGEERYRRVQPIRIYYGRTDYYPEPQWLLAADDLEKNCEYRVFAMANIRDVVGPQDVEFTLALHQRDSAPQSVTADQRGFVDRAIKAKRMLRMNPGYIGTADAAESLIDDMLAALTALDRDDKALRHAQRLATVLWEKHWKADAPDWKVGDNLLLVIDQIDNAVASLVRHPLIAENRED